MLTKVHQTAVIHPTATVADDVEIGPYAVIGERCFIDRGTKLGAHVVIEPYTSIGRDCLISSGAVIGGVPQDLKFQGAESYCVIGDRNVIRECVTINRATAAGDVTRIGHDNLLMAYVHVAHDCIVGSHTTLANNATLGGHVELGDWVTVGGLTGIHQFVKVGAHAMLGFQSAVSQDVPPFLLVDGNPLAVRGVNVIGLRRRDFSAERIAAIRQMHKLLYREGRTLESARTAIDELARTVPEAAQDVAQMAAFLAAATRGIAR